MASITARLGAALAILLAARRRLGNDRMEEDYERFQGMLETGYKPPNSENLDSAFSRAVEAEEEALILGTKFDREAYEATIKDLANAIETAFRVVGAPARQNRSRPSGPS